MNKIYLFRNVSVLLLVFLSVILVVFSNESVAEEEVSVNSFGATGAGKIDETDFIQKAIDFQSAKGGGKVYIPKGVYLIDAIKSIVLKDNIDLEFDQGAILQALPNNKDGYEVLEIHDVKNVNILGSAEIIGERKNHIGTTGEWGFGISVRGSNNINIENVKISNCWGDGIYLGSTPKQAYNQDVNIINPLLDNNRRQGISVISAVNLNINNAIITNTNGTNPQSGIDLEPNSNKEKLININISNLSTNNNKGYGLFVYLKSLKGSKDSISIYVDKTSNIKDGFAVREVDGVSGTINFAGYYYLNDKFSDYNSSHWAYEEVNYLTGKKILTGYPDGRLLPEKNTTRAEAAKMLSIALNLQTPNVNMQYRDVSSHWAKNYIAAATKSGLFNGYPGGSFKPDQVLTRAEMSKILVVAYKLEGSSSNGFSDISNSWAKSHISTLIKNGITTGFPNNTFQPNAATTRTQFSAFLARSMNPEFRK